MKIIGFGKWKWRILLALDHLAVIVIELFIPALIAGFQTVQIKFTLLYSAQAVCAIGAICIVQKLVDRRDLTFRCYVEAMLGMGVATGLRLGGGVGLLNLLYFGCLLVIHRMLAEGEIAVKTVRFGMGSFVFWLIWLFLVVESILIWNLCSW